MSFGGRLTGMWRRLLLVLAIVASTLVLHPAPAYACSCAPMTTGERMNFSAVVFTGTVTRLDAPFEAFSPDFPNVFTFHVDHAYKGAPTAALEVTPHTQGPRLRHPFRARLPLAEPSPGPRMASWRPGCAAGTCRSPRA